MPRSVIGRCLCWLGFHRGPIEVYGPYAYIDCRRCGRIRQPMPTQYARVRFDL